MTQSTSPLALRVAFLASLLLSLAAAEEGRAWTLYNETSGELEYEVYDESLKLIEEGTLAKVDTDGASFKCDWDKNSCNPGKARGNELTVLLKSRGKRWACSQLMLAGGYVLAYEVGNGSLPSTLYCLSQINEWADKSEDRVDVNGDGVKNVDKYVDVDWSDDYLASRAIRSGSATYTAADRNVRFLITGDPQIDFRGLKTCGNRDRCEIDPDSSIPNDDDAELAFDTFLEMTDLLRANHYAYKRWNSDVRGIIVSGDLTATARWSETKYYMQMSTADNIFTDGDVSTPKRHPWDQHIPLMEKLYEGMGNHDHVDETHADHDDRKFCDAGPSFNESRNNCEVWIADYVAGHKRSTRQTTEATIGDDFKDIETYEPHYSWDWHDVHFVQLNVVPVDDVVPNRPHVLGLGALSFLKDDLASSVGDSGRPVVLIHHYGLDSFSLGSEEWWTDTELVPYWNAIAKYNVIAIFTGHDHKSPTSFDWDHSFSKPPGADARDDGRGSIDTFNAAAAFKGTYLDVTIDSCNVMTVRRGTQTETVEFSAPTDRSLACDPTAECIPVTVPANADCEGVHASIAGAASFGFCTLEPPEPYALGDTSVKLTCENEDGSLSADCSETVTVEDTRAPVLLCPEFAGEAFECGEPLAWNAATGDNCTARADLTVTCTPTPNAPAELWMNDEPGQCTSTDLAGNLARCRTTDRLWVRDTRKPRVTLAGEEFDTTECGAGPYADPMGSAEDLCDAGGLALTRTPEQIDTSEVGQQVITYEAKDSSGNVGEAKRGLFVVDSTPPVLQLHGEKLEAAECTLGAVWADPGARAADRCWGELEVTTSAAVDLGQLGPQTVTYSTQDGSGHGVAIHRIVRVQDNLPPTVRRVGTAVEVFECDLAASWVDRGAIAEDQCAGVLPVTTEGVVLASAVGDYGIVYSAADAVGLSDTANRLVQVRDTQAPAIALVGPAEQTLECGVDAYVEQGAEATDACSGVLAVSTSGDVDVSSVDDYTVRYEAQDGQGLASSIERLVHVADTTAPSIVCDDDVVVEPVGPEGTVVTFGASASDACDGTPTVVCPRSGDTFAPGTTTEVGCVARDDHANLSPCRLLVQVLSEAEVAGVLDEELTVLADSGTINSGQTKSIDKKLDKILEAIDAGDDGMACEQLSELELQIAEFVFEGTLTGEEAAAIASTTANLIATLECPPPVVVE